MDASAKSISDAVFRTRGIGALRMNESTNKLCTKSASEPESISIRGPSPATSLALGGELSGKGFADPRRSASHHGPRSEAGGKVGHVVLLWESRSSGRETLAEGDQEPWRTPDPNLPPQQCPHQVFLLPQKAD